MQSSSLPDNRFNQMVTRIQALPLPRSVQRWLVSRGAGLVVPYLSTSSVEFDAVTSSTVTLSLRNRRKVQNHMKTVHACAMFLLAEAATGVVLSANLPEGARLSTTHVEIDYVRRAVGDLRATAELDEAAQRAVRGEPKGRLCVPVIMRDAKGNEPARFVIEWSWKHAAARAA